MRELGPAAERDMVLAFLQAEIDSARFGQTYATILSNSGLQRSSIIDNPDMQSEWEDSLRIKLLQAVRGYRSDTFLFQGFPQDVRWRKIEIEPDDFGKLKYANYETWVQLSGGSRLVVDGAKNIENVVVEDANRNITAVVDSLRCGKRYPPLIAVKSEDGFLVLVEGHTRATAYVLAQIAEPVQVIVASSQKIKNWSFY
jgi:hypothetical protein